MPPMYEEMEATQKAEDIEKMHEAMIKKRDEEKLQKDILELVNNL